MNEDQFWAFIDQSIATDGKANSLREQTQKLMCLLELLDKNSYLDFITQFKAKLFDAYTWDLWAVAYIAYNFTSESGFEEFRAWLISRGRQNFEAALADFHVAADLVLNYLPLQATGEESEEFCLRPLDFFEAVFGEHYYDLLPEDVYMYGDREPSGERWLPENLYAKYPELCQLFGRVQSDFL
ncbi:MAG: DUF4240 domain-containing protein [Candidatus Obscuribacterales bacterium]|nr:DUF4240 domain-containing protein [Candidatus Obscuribacterales bacterium]